MKPQHSEICQERASAAALYQRHAPVLLAYLRRHAASWEDAEDLLLEVFTAALEDERFPGIAEEKQIAWLQRVAQHKLVDYYRRSARRPAIPLGAESDTLMEDEALAPEQVALRHEAQAQLRIALQRLPAPQRELLQLRFAHGLSGAEIAAVLGKQEGAVRVLLWRALKLLRSYYVEPGEGEQRHG